MPEINQDDPPSFTGGVCLEYGAIGVFFTGLGLIIMISYLSLSGIGPFLIGALIFFFGIGHLDEAFKHGKSCCDKCYKD